MESATTSITLNRVPFYDQVRVIFTEHKTSTDICDNIPEFNIHDIMTDSSLETIKKQVQIWSNQFE